MKTKLAIILAALLIAASMTSCGNGKKNDETTQSNKIDINTETPANGNESENTTEAPNETTQPGNGTTDSDEIKDPGEYTYTALEQAEKIQILSATGAATLRTADYAVLTSVPNGTQLDRVGISNGANGFWSQVVYNGEICYIASHLVTIILDLDDGFVDVNKTLTKNDGSLKVRVAPDVNSEVIGYINAGQKVVVVAENTTTGWYKISFIPYGATEATIGYIASNPEYYETEAATTEATETTEVTEEAASEATE